MTIFKQFFGWTIHRRWRQIASALIELHPEANFHAWIWAVGSAAWTFDAIVNLYYRNRPHAELSFLVAVMFAIAWAFYSRQPTR